MKIFFTIIAIVFTILGSVFFLQKQVIEYGDESHKIKVNKLQQYSVITVNTKHSSILFGGIDYHKKDSKNFSEFNRHYAGDFIKKIQKIFPETHIVINGQFFNAGQEKTHMSFPLKSNGKIINDYMDNDIPKRTLLQKSNGEVVLYDGYNPSDLKDDSVKELIVGFSPTVDASAGVALGRNYAILDGQTLIFFVAKSKTQKEMEQLISQYGYSLQQAIMFDGGPSAQYATIHDQKTYYGDWEVPQFFVIGEK